MYFYNAFTELAARIRSGDLSAKVQLREQLQNELIHIVRRALRAGKAILPLDRRILAEARQVCSETGEAEVSDGEWLCLEVTCRLCDVVIAQLKPASNGGGIGNTIYTCAAAATQLTV